MFYFAAYASCFSKSMLLPTHRAIGQPEFGLSKISRISSQPFSSYPSSATGRASLSAYVMHENASSDRLKPKLSIFKNSNQETCSDQPETFLADEANGQANAEANDKANKDGVVFTDPMFEQSIHTHEVAEIHHEAAEITHPIDEDFFMDEALAALIKSGDTAKTDQNKGPAPRDPELSKVAKRISLALNELQKRLPEKTVQAFFEQTKNRLKSSASEASFAVKLSNYFLDSIQDVNDEAGQEEYVYLLLKSMNIIEEAIQSIDGAESKQPSFITSFALNGIDRIATSPLKFDPFGVLGLYKNMIDQVSGSRKTQVYDLLTSVKNGLLESIGREDPNSFSAKMKLFLYLVVCIDTGQEIEVEEFVDALQDLGIIASKAVQILGSQSKNPVFEDGGTKSKLIEACKSLQQYNRPMTPQAAKAQMAVYYEKQFGPQWQEKMFKSIDFSKPFRTGTIAGVYKAIAANGQPVVVKIKKPGLEQELAENKVQIGKILNAMYKIVGEAVDAQKRLERPVPKLLDLANLFQKSEASVNQFFDQFETELHFDNEAKSLLNTQCRTPQVISYTPNVIIMDYVDKGLTPLEFVEISAKTAPVNYAKASTAVEAVNGWLKTHYPFEIQAENGIQITQLPSSLRVLFKDTAIDALNFKVQGVPGQWKVEPQDAYVDYSAQSREILAAQSIVDLITQLSEGVLNCDTHGGNFIVAPGDKIGTNHVYNIDFGLVARLDAQESKLAWNFIKGFLFKSDVNIAKSYLQITSKAQVISDEAFEEALTEFTHYLKDTKYLEMLSKDPDKAMADVMEWLASNDFDIDSKFYAINRSFLGVASNVAVMQNNRPISIKQVLFLTEELLKNKNLVNGHIILDCLTTLKNNFKK